MVGEGLVGWLVGDAGISRGKSSRRSRLKITQTGLPVDQASVRRLSGGGCHRWLQTATAASDAAQYPVTKQQNLQR
jgi:hypothetical protein